MNNERMIKDNERGFTVLLVEDREEDIDITKQAITESEVTINLTVAKDGSQALNYLLALDESGEEPLPDLILLDLNLPKIDGREVLKKIHGNDYLRAIPTIVLTVSEQEKDIARAYDSGAAGYITKPIDFRDFVKTIDIVTKYWDICRKPDPRKVLEEGFD